MKQFVILLSLLALAIVMLSCGSTRKVASASESVGRVELVESTTNSHEASTNAATWIEKQDESMTVEHIVYDTSRYDSTTGTSPILSYTTARKESNAERCKETSLHKITDETIESVSESIIYVDKQKQKESAISETKQPLYLMYMFIGLAFMVAAGFMVWMLIKWRANQ